MTSERRVGCLAGARDEPPDRSKTIPCTEGPTPRRIDASAQGPSSSGLASEVNLQLKKLENAEAGLQLPGAVQRHGQIGAQAGGHQLGH